MRASHERSLPEAKRALKHSLSVSFTQRVQSIRVTCDERFLFCATPAFQLPFSVRCVCQGSEGLDIDQFERPSLRRVVRGRPLVVRSLSRFKIAGVSDVETSVGTAKDVDVRHPTTMSSSGGVDQSGFGDVGMPFDSRLRRSLRAPFDSARL